MLDTKVVLATACLGVLDVVTGIVPGLFGCVVVGCAFVVVNLLVGMTLFDFVELVRGTSACHKEINALITEQNLFITNSSGTGVILISVTISISYIIPEQITPASS